MGLTMAQRKAVTRELAQRYRRATRREKGEILDQRVQLTGHTRNHASWLLRGWGRTVYSYQGVDRSRSWSAPGARGEQRLLLRNYRCFFVSITQRA